MNIKIGKYRSWIGPYQVLDWFKPILGEKVIESITESDTFDKVTTFIQPAFEYIEARKKRKIKIHIDKWDTWSMDHTLGLIILPMLKQLKKDKHGSPEVDDEDVPDRLHRDKYPITEEFELDDLVHLRWGWVMDEMIWAFEQIIDNDSDSKFHTGIVDIKFVKIEGTDMSKMVRTDKDTSVFDRDGWKKHHKRINRGTTLFGKYYRGLWD